MDKATAKHNSYIGHSVIGENCNIACGTVTADYRHDSKSNTTLVQGKKIDTGRRKLGAFIGDNVRTGIGTLIYPGRKIWPNKSTLPGQVVKEDIVD
jgi:bifunctional UDP-N-acetylglucosamine pyrophosphorylase/glucosamine-1-phosphate N-acetyltransferase